MGYSTALDTMPKNSSKKGGKGQQPAASKGVGNRQLAFRVSEDFADRVEAAGKKLGLDLSNFLRMMVLECLPMYEDRGRKIAESSSPRDPG